MDDDSMNAEMDYLTSLEQKIKEEVDASLVSFAIGHLSANAPSPNKPVRPLISSAFDANSLRFGTFR